MPRKTLCKDDIINYVHPELETLKALFSSLNLKASMAAVDFAENVFELELNRVLNPDLKTSEDFEENNGGWKV